MIPRIQSTGPLAQLSQSSFYSSPYYSIQFINYAQLLHYILSPVYSCCRPYYLLIVARKNFNELLVTAIVDTPPEEGETMIRRGPGFVIQRMGEPNI